VRFEFESGIVLFCLSFIFVLLENHVCLSRGVQVAGAIWRASTRTGDGRTGRVLGGRAVERSGGAVCGLHLTHGD
jgi:hypothetical protein